jgi:hypothetical protein
MSSRQERSEYDTLLFPRNILANEIAAMKHRCCSSEDADVAKINFMYFNPGGQYLSTACGRQEKYLVPFFYLGPATPAG